MWKSERSILLWEDIINYVCFLKYQKEEGGVGQGGRQEFEIGVAYTVGLNQELFGTLGKKARSPEGQKSRNPEGQKP